MALNADAIQKLRSEKGLTAEQLPDDPTDEQVTAAILAEPVAPTPPEAEKDEKDEQEETPETETPALQATGGIPPETLAQLQADAAMGRQARQEQLQMERDSFVAAHVQRGAIPPSARDAYRSQLEQGGDIEKQTRAFLTSAPSVLPVGEVGTAGTADASADQSDYIDTHLSDEERRKIEAHRAGTTLPRQRVITEA